MTRWLFLLCALAMVVAARAGAQAPRTPPQPIVPQDVVAFLDQAVSEAMARDNVAGVVASVVIDGKPAIHRGWGKAALDPTRHMDGEQTLVRIGSIGKVMTWILVLQQAEEGRLDLDADINTQLRADIRVAPGPGRAVTLRDLMAHRGGFEDRAFGHLFANSAADVLPPERWVMTRQPARVRPAGTASSYSNFATALAGVAAVHASGTRDYPTLIETRLFQPLGMTSSTAREPYPPRADLPAPMPSALAGRRSAELVWSADRFQTRQAEYITQVMPAGGMYATAADMARFMAALLGDGRLGEARLFGQATAAALRTPLVETGPCGNGWRHGLFTSCTDAGIPTVGHNGATLNFTSEMLLVPEQGFGIFIAANSPTSDRLTSQVAEAVVNRFMADRVAAVPLPSPGSPSPAVGLAQPDGVYLHSRRATSGLEGFLGLLSSQQRVRLDPRGELFVDDSGWQPGQAPGQFVQTDSHGALTLITDAAGRATALVPDHHVIIWEKAAWWQDLRLLAALAVGVAAFSLLAPAGAWITRKAPHRRGERWSVRLALAGAALWLASMAAFAVWGWRAEDPAAVAFVFPGPWLGAASVLALLAGLTAIAQLPLLPALVGRGGWPAWRRAGHGLGLVLSLALAATLLAWGALPPWG